MIEAHELSRRFGEFTAVDDVSFAVEDGEIVGILGPNGAGKTTTIRMITGFLPPTSGRVTLAGHDLEREPLAARRQLGYLPENIALYPEMRVREYLRYRARLQGMSGAEARRAVPETMERGLVTEVADQVIGTLSKGYRQRVGLAMAILHDPRVLVLDEPTVGLDPKQIIAIRELIRELGRRHTLLLSTHILPEVELICDRVIIFDRGRIVAHGTPESLEQQWVGKTVVRVGLADGAQGARAALAAIPGVDAVEPGAVDASYLLETERSIDVRAEVFRAAVERGWTLVELAEERASLEDVFVRLTTRDAAAAGEEGADPAAAPAESGPESGGDGGEEVAS